ncbi:MAG: YciI family protein [Alphaproteobacteria bacterium]
MLFFLVAKDGTDKDALARRLAVREQHIALSEEAIKKGEQILGCAILNDNKEMAGSIMLVDFEDRKKLNEWLENEPYVTGNVWDDIEIYPCQIGPSFQHILKKTS